MAEPIAAIGMTFGVHDWPLAQVKQCIKLEGSPMGRDTLECMAHWKAP